MYDCSDDISKYHDNEVTLPQPERKNMRGRRNANRNRLENGLEKQGKPKALDTKSQGSYAMKTMVQHPKKDYDIDDGVYFDKSDLIGPRGGEMSTFEARQMVRDAVDDGSFKRKPEVKKNCVRVYYDAGYHVDIPVYRRITEINWLGQESYYYELASSSSWKRSDARDVTAWFDNENQRLSPDETNGRQLRRVVRLLKKFAKSRESWSGIILSGFGITKLVSECFHAALNRDDQALYYTMKAIRDRLNGSLRVDHPVTPNATITKEDNDPKARFIRDKLSEALTVLEPLFTPNCSQQEALTAWNKVFSVSYFTDRFDSDSVQFKAQESDFLTAGLLKTEAAPIIVQNSVQKQGGGRYA